VSEQATLVSKGDIRHPFSQDDLMRLKFDHAGKRF
jgi:hypothetical protein